MSDILNRIKAEDRCHRVGQTKEVKVIRFTSEVIIFFALLFVNRRGGGIYLLLNKNCILKLSTSVTDQKIVLKKKKISA